VKEKVEKVISEKIRPGLQADGGDIELIDVSNDGVVKVKLQGACSGCPMAQMTLQFGVEKALRDAIPEFKELVNIR
jgi:Fe-S cluster biogenesis protein NfuA